MCSLTLETIVRRSDAPLSTQIDHEMVLMSLERGNYYGLNETATLIWQRLEQPTSIAALCQQLAAEYAADATTIERDVLVLLEQLQTEGFLEQVV